MEITTGKKLHAAILKVMKKVEYLNKSEAVQNFKAVSSEKVTIAVREALIENNLTIVPISVQPTRAHEVWEEQGKRKNQFVTHVLCTYKITHCETGESETFMSEGTGIDTLDKAPGKALTYAMKSALLALFMIPTGHKEDVINELDEEGNIKEPPKPKLTDVIMKNLQRRKDGDASKNVAPLSCDEMIKLSLETWEVSEEQIKTIKSWYA